MAVQNHMCSYEFWLSALAISYSKGYAPLLDVRKSCVPSCCFSAPYTCCNDLWIVKGFFVWTLYAQ